MPFSVLTDGLSFVTETTLNLDSSHELKNIRNQVATLTHFNLFESRPLNVTISSGSGDADLYVRSGAQPTTSSYDCRPSLSGNNESCSAAMAGEDLYIMLRAYYSFSGVTLNVTEN
ncbi:PPC domain-containing protein [Vibrio jasicida]|uniref:PPC domain-containing protein n=1 Tax=Vibrio jasicida TaxID=766224 RepID=UPI00391F6BA7